MILQPVRTSNLQFPLHEMVIGDAIDLCDISPDLHEMGTSLTLKAIIPDSIDPRSLTVQERAFIVAQYVAQTNDGNPDFAIGDAKLSDYLMLDNYKVDEIYLNEMHGDKWYISPLLGVHTESIERLILQERLIKRRGDWWMAAMACMMRRPEDEKNDWLAMKDVEVDDFIYDRIQVLKNYPEHQFPDLLYFFLHGVSQIDHLFKMDFQDNGIVFTAIEREGSAVLPPARFHFNSTISQSTIQIFGNPTEQGV